MEINIDRIKSRFNGKLLKEDIVKVYNDFKRIDEILKLRLGLEESICKYFRCRLNIGVCFDEISKLNIKLSYHNVMMIDLQNNTISLTFEINQIRNEMKDYNVRKPFLQ